MSVGLPFVALAKVARPVSRSIPVVTGQSYRTLGVRWWGEGAYERQTIDGSQTAAKTLNIVRANDLIINKIWVRHGSTAIVCDAMDGCVGSGEFPTFELDRSRVDPRWLHWLTKTRSFWNCCDRLSQGTSGKNRIRPELFLTIEIPLPALPEQQRIVARIEELAGKIEKARELGRQTIVQADVLARSQLFSISSEHRIGVLSEGIDTIKNGLSRRPTGTENGPIVLRLADVSNRNISLKNPRRGDLSNDEARAYGLIPGDLLFVRVNGSRDIVGRCIPFLEADEPVCFNDHLMRVRVNPIIFDSNYVAVVVNSLSARRCIEAMAITTAGQLTINQTMLSRIPIPIIPVEEQQRIAARVAMLQAKVDEVKALQARTQAELDALLPSVLDRAFRGEL
jgi:type I restriction enzyme S subunit